MDIREKRANEVDPIAAGSGIIHKPGRPKREI
jgi:hypothetical protein